MANCELGRSSTMAARVSVALRLKSEAADRLGLQRASWTRSFGLYRDRAWHGRPRADRRSVGVRFDTEPEEEEGDADVRAWFISETEREGRRAAAAGARGQLGFDFGPRTVTSKAFPFSFLFSIIV